VRSKAVVFAAALAGLVWFFFPRGEAPEVGKQTTGGKKVANRPTPEVLPIQVPKPKPTSGKNITPTALDTNWDKDGDGKVDAGFTGVRMTYFDSQTKKQIKLKSQYTNGLRQGAEQHYQKTGELVLEVTYSKGEKLGLVQFRIDGSVVLRQTLEAHKTKTLTSYYRSGQIRSKSERDVNSTEYKQWTYSEGGDLIGKTINNSDGTKTYFEYFPTGELKKQTKQKKPPFCKAMVNFPNPNSIERSSTTKPKA